MTEARAENHQDAAWVTIETPFGSAALLAFLEDIERLYRINPMLVFEDWQQTGDRQYRLKAENLSNGKRLDTGLDVEYTIDGVTVRYDLGLRSSTRFRVDDNNGHNAKLIVTDDYSGSSEAERELRIDEVDKSLVHWGNSLYRYLRQWKRWSWFPGWRFYMRKIWQPMKPSARRITYILLIITLAELALFALVFTVFLLELDKYIG
jgi:hypothetical protein